MTLLVVVFVGLRMELLAVILELALAKPTSQVLGIVESSSQQWKWLQRVESQKECLKLGIAQSIQSSINRVMLISLYRSV